MSCRICYTLCAMHTETPHFRSRLACKSAFLQSGMKDRVHEVMKLARDVRGEKAIVPVESSFPMWASSHSPPKDSECCECVGQLRASCLANLAA